MKKMKRALAMLLVAMMVFSFMPTLTFASEPGGPAGNSSQQIVQGTGGESPRISGPEGTYIDLSKTIEGTEIENEFNITLKVVTNEVVKTEYTADVAVVLVLDASGSMLTHASSYNDNVKRIEEQRMNKAVQALNKFIDDFADTKGVVGQRWVSVVVFSNDATLFVPWTQLAGADGEKISANIANAKLEYKKTSGKANEFNKKDYYTLSNKLTGTAQKKMTGGDFSSTNISAGLNTAKDQINKTGASAPPNSALRNCILLSDGVPNLPDNENTGKSSAVTAATSLKNTKSTTLYTIGYGSGLDSQGQKWLKESIATSADKHSSVEDGDSNATGGLNFVFSAIDTDIKASANAWSVYDPMGEYIEFVDFIGNSSMVTLADDKSNFTWDLKNNTVNRVDTGSENSKIFTYTLKYKVRLNNLVQDWVAGQAYDTNKPTKLRYSFTVGTSETPVATADFKIPKVKGYANSLSFQKTTDGTAKLTGAKFKLVETDGKTYEATSDGNGNVAFSNIPSGHTYTLTEDEAPVGYQKSNASFKVEVKYGYIFINDSLIKAATQTELKNKFKNPKLGVVTVTKQFTSGQVAVDDPTLNATFMLEFNGGKVYDGAVAQSSPFVFTVANKGSKTFSVESGVTYTITENSINDYPTTTVDGETKNAVTHTSLVSENKTYNFVNDKNEYDDITVTKNWIGGVADSITIVIRGYKGEATFGEKITRTFTKGELGTGDTWQCVFENLITKHDGTTVTYRIVNELDVVGFDVSYDESTLSITNISNDDITFSVEKKWVGPQSEWENATVTIGLFQSDNDDEPLETVTLTGAKTVAFKPVPKYNENGEILYYVKEINGLSGYDADVTTLEKALINDNTFIVTNTREQEEISINGEKTWCDDEDALGLRPEMITVKLLRDRTVIDTKTVKADQDGKWSYDFGDNFPQYDEDNDYALFVYTVEEVEITLANGDKYVPEYIGYDIENTLSSDETVDISGTKTWELLNDVSEYEDVTATFTLHYLNGGPVDGIAPAVLGVTDTVIKFTNLPKYADGKLLEYTIVETVTPAGFNSYRTPGTNDFTNTETDDEFKTIDVSKTWIQTPGKLTPNLTLHLIQYKDDVATGIEIPVNFVAGKTSEDTSFTVTVEVENVPNYYYSEVEGVIDAGYYSYKLVEKDDHIPAGYTLHGISGFTATNIELTTLGVIKVWNGYVDPSIESLTMTLKSGRSTIDSLIISKDVMENMQNAVSFKAVPKYRADGSLINYRVEETINGVPSGYTTTVNRTDDVFTVTNTRNVTYTQYSGQKTWVSGARNFDKPAITIQLQVSINGGAWEDVADSAKTFEANARNYRYQWKNLVKIDKDNNLYEYRVEERFVNEDDADDFVVYYNGKNVLNVHKSASYTVNKIWMDPYTTHSDITITLLANGVPTDETVILGDNQEWGWTYTFTDLPYADGRGNRIRYSVREEFDDVRYEAPDYRRGGTIINKIAQQQFSIDVSKVWSDGDDNHADDEVTVQLMVSDGTATATPVGAAITLNANNDWAHTFGELDMYTATGKLYVYTIEETDVRDDYKASYSDGVTGETDEPVLTVTNTPRLYNYQIIRHYTTRTYDWQGNLVSENVINDITAGVQAGQYQQAFVIDDEGETYKNYLSNEYDFIEGTPEDGLILTNDAEDIAIVTLGHVINLYYEREVRLPREVDPTYYYNVYVRTHISDDGVNFTQTGSTGHVGTYRTTTGYDYGTPAATLTANGGEYSLTSTSNNLSGSSNRADDVIYIDLYYVLTEDEPEVTPTPTPDPVDPGEEDEDFEDEDGPTSDLDPAIPPQPTKEPDDEEFGDDETPTGELPFTGGFALGSLAFIGLGIMGLGIITGKKKSK